MSEQFDENAVVREWIQEEGGFARPLLDHAAIEQLSDSQLSAMQPGEFVPAVRHEPMLYLWDYLPPVEGADGVPTFLAIALTEDQAREAIIGHPEVGQLLASAEFKALVLGPPTRVIEPEQGAVFVLNYQADRVEAI